VEMNIFTRSNSRCHLGMYLVTFSNYIHNHGLHMHGSSSSNCYNTNIPPYTVMQYIGDNTKAENISHGNAKRDNRPFQRSVPLVLTRLVQQVRDHRLLNVHKTAVMSAEELQDVPCTQIKNVRERVMSAARLSDDGLANLHELAYDLLTMCG